MNREVNITTLNQPCINLSNVGLITLHRELCYCMKLPYLQSGAILINCCVNYYVMHTGVF
jgi:hypothetical protein